MLFGNLASHAQTAATKLYWVQSSNTSADDRLRTANLDGSSAADLASGNSASTFINPQSLWVDAANNVVYVGDGANTGSTGISRFNATTGAYLANLVAGSSTVSYNGIQVVGNRLYWVQSSGTADNDRLCSANLDGTNVTVLASGNSASTFINPQSLRVDATNNVVYVGDGANTGSTGISRFNATTGAYLANLVAGSSTVSFNGIATNAIVTPNPPLVNILANGSVTNNTSPTYSGTAATGSTVTVYVDGSSIGTTTSVSSSWTLIQPTTLSSGSHTIYATATAEGFTSGNSPTNTFTIDTTAPTVVITSSASNPTSSSPIPVTVTFSESVTGVIADDVTVTNGIVSGFTGSGASYNFSVTPAASGLVTVSVSASVAQDVAGNPNTAAPVFSLQYQAPPVNTPPVATTNASQTATVGMEFTYTVNAFSDDTPNSLTYTATIAPANGLSFDPATRVISGTPSLSGVSTVTVMATDPGSLSANTSFTITVNPAPVVITSLTLVASASPTTILTTGTTTLSATISGGTTPYSYTFNGPGTITYSGNTASVSGLSAGVQTFTVIVGDATTPTSQTISATVSVTVTAANQSPLATANANQTATVGTAFTYTVNAFSDETPASLTYTATIVPANGLSFDPATRVISGTPSLSGVSTVTVTATDPGGLSASTVFAITVSGSATQPTGPATLTITSFNCFSTAETLSSVNFVVGYSNNTFTPALPPLFINGVTASGQLGVPYTFNFDTNASGLSVADNASRQVYFVWDFRAACAGVATPPAQPTPPVAPTLPNQTASQGTPFTYTLPAFGGSTPINYTAAGLPAGLSFEASSRTISGTASLTGVSTVVISASNAAGQSSGQFTITVSGSATQPTGPATLTITSFNCFSTAETLSSVNFVVGYSNNTFTPALPPLFINGVTASGQLGVPYTFNFDTNASGLSVADNASRQVYFVWDFRAACAGVATPPAPPSPPVAPTLPNQTASQGTPFTYTLPAFGGSTPINYTAMGLPPGLSFEASSRTISGTPSLTGVSTVVISASNAAGQSSGQFTITVSGSATQPPVGQPLSLLAPSYDCGTGAFTFRSSGGDGSAIEYFAVGITTYTTIAGPYTVLPAGDAQPFTLKARQSGVEVTYTWDFKAVCSGSGRVGIAEVAETWMLRSVGNPVTGELVVEVVGAAGQSLQLQLTDLNGHVVASRLVIPTTAQHREVFEVARQGAGVLLLQAQSPTRRQTLKVLKQ